MIEENELKELGKLINKIPVQSPDMLEMISSFKRTMERQAEWSLERISYEGDNKLTKAVITAFNILHNRVTEAKTEASRHFEDDLHTKYSLNQAMKNPDNLTLLDEILEDYPRIIKKMESVIELAKTYQDNNDTFKEIKGMKEGDEMIFFYDGKLSRKGKNYIIGRDENQKKVGFTYAWIWNYDKYNNLTWEQDAAYLIKHTGMSPKYRKLAVFSISKIDA